MLQDMTAPAPVAPDASATPMTSPEPSATMCAWIPLPKVRRCADLPKVQATFVTSAEDFHVEEMPAYTPCGAGEHAYLWLEKKNLSADALLEHIARVFAVPRRDIGYAGLKDTRATTRQYVSLPKAAVKRLAADWAACAALVDNEQVRLIEGNDHQNKLRVGHLRGNKFTVTLRGAAPGDVERAQAIASRLQTCGFPNYYGPQRFGRDNSTLRQGLSLLQKEAPRGRKNARGAWLDKLALSAVQSALFNDYVTLRARQGQRDKVVPGDVLQVRASGGQFLTTEPDIDQARFDAREVVPAGPMFGPDMKPAARGAAAMEQEALLRAGLDAEAFTRHKRLTQGTRRATLVWLDGIDVEAGPDATLQLRFSLPSGSYATELVEEFTGLGA